MPRRYADSSLAIHPVPSENIPGRPLVVVLRSRVAAAPNDIRPYGYRSEVQEFERQFPRKSWRERSSSNFNVAERSYCSKRYRDLPWNCFEVSTSILSLNMFLHCVHVLFAGWNAGAIHRLG